MRKVLRILGSLKSAVVMLTLLAVVLVWSTFFESAHGTPAAQRVIYRAWWFSALLGLLLVNVAAAALVRYPWKPHQTGFVVTHAGIIILLLGSLIGYQFGVDGHVTLREGGHADRVTIEQETVRVTDDEGQLLRIILLDLEHRPLPAAGTHHRLGRGMKLEIQQAHANTREALVVEPGAETPNPAVRVALHSVVAGDMTLDQWLLPRDPDHAEVNLGPAVLRAAEARTPQELATLTTPPPQDDPGQGTISLHVAAGHFEFKVADVLGKRLPLGATGFSIEVRDYLADFRWDSQAKKPISVSDEPNNPAVVMTVQGPNTDISYLLFADHPDMTIAHAKSGDEKSTKPVYRFIRRPRVSQFIVVTGPGEALRYVVQGSKGQFKTGELRPVPERREVKTAELDGLKRQFASLRVTDRDEELGTVTVETGRTIWGRPDARDPSRQSIVETGLGDWQLQVLDYVPKAKARTELQPASVSAMDTRRFPALRVALHKNGQASKPTWVRWGMDTPVAVGDARVAIAYGWQTYPLGFMVTLKKFQAKRYEGTDTPADFRSFITITDNQHGVSLNREVWMNNPVVHPEGWMGTRGFKFSQASYREPDRPGEANESTLGVMWDPGWPLKFFGFCTIIAGIFIMYYMKAYFFKPHERTSSPRPAPRQEQRPQPANVRAGVG